MKRIASWLTALVLALTIVPPMGANGENEALTPLKDVYKEYFLIGNIFTEENFNGGTYESLSYHYNAMTAENMMKPNAMQSSPGNFRFAMADKIIEYFEGEGVNVIGHTLAWHQQSPKFLNTNVTRAQAEENLKQHIQTVAGHFSGKILSWDVLNEAIIDGPGTAWDWTSALRRSDWYTAFAQDGGEGADYVYMAFKLAREADPHAILYYNDYNLNNAKKAKATYNMVKEINEMYLAEGNDRLLIEGIGMQGHYNTATNISEVEASLELFRELGVEVSVTELDVCVNGAARSGLTAEEEEYQALVYAQLFTLYKQYSDIIARVTFWGINDSKSWRRERFPLLFKGDDTPKLAYYAVLDPEGFLAERGIETEVKPVRSEAAAVYGTPTVDGVAEDIWNDVEALPVDIMLQAWQTASGTVKLMWDAEALYALFEVKDSSLDKASMQPHEQDSVEIFLDQWNCKAGDFSVDDGQYRVCFDGSESFGDTTRKTGFVSAAVSGEASYVVEMKIPMTQIEPQNDMLLGFDAQINDARNGARQGIAKWNDATDNSFVDTANWGVIALTGAEGYVEPFEREDADDSGSDHQNEGATSPSASEDGAKGDASSGNNDGGNPWVFIIIGIAVLGVGCGVFVMMRRGRK